MCQIFSLCKQLWKIRSETGEMAGQIAGLTFKRMSLPLPHLQVPAFERIITPPVQGYQLRETLLLGVPLCCQTSFITPECQTPLFFVDTLPCLCTLVSEAQYVIRQKWGFTPKRGLQFYDCCPQKTQILTVQTGVIFDKKSFIFIYFSL